MIAVHVLATLFLALVVIVRVFFFFFFEEMWFYNVFAFCLARKLFFSGSVGSDTAGLSTLALVLLKLIGFFFWGGVISMVLVRGIDIVFAISTEPKAAAPCKVRGG